MADWQADPNSTHLSREPEIWCDWLEDQGHDLYAMRFALIYGDGSGSGYGSGDGYGYGYGYGYGDGDGSGYGYGDGYGYG